MGDACLAAVPAAKPRTVARIRRDGLRHNELNRAKEERLRRQFLRK